MTLGLAALADTGVSKKKSSVQTEIRNAAAGSATLMLESSILGELANVCELIVLDDATAKQIFQVYDADRLFISVQDKQIRNGMCFHNFECFSSQTV